MGNGFIFEMVRRVNIEKLLHIIGMMGVVLTFVHLFMHPYGNKFSVLSHEKLGLDSLITGGKALFNNSELTNSSCFYDQKSRDMTLSLDDMRLRDNESEMKRRDLCHGSIFEMVKHANSDRSAKTDQVNSIINVSTGRDTIESKFYLKEQKGSFDVNVSIDSDNKESGGSLHEKEGKEVDFVPSDKKLSSASSVLSIVANTSLLHDNTIDIGTKLKFNDSSSMHDGSLYSSDSNVLANTPALQKRGGKAFSITQMNSLLLDISAEVKSNRKRRSSARDEEMKDASFQIANAPIYRNISEVHASLFRNYSMFKRSYELMESTLKVYVYREGEKPFFHQPHLRGIYASEGWFMKLMERNKQFVVKEPKKAHLFYLAFSMLKLRRELRESGFVGEKGIEKHLKNFVDIISTKYRFWNKSSGADHFFVACHDWAPRATRKIFGTSIGALCNSNMASGFKIGKDVSLPVTRIRSSESPLKDIGGNPPSNRAILAFFAGGMHGYVRPILLQHWYNKEPDMKIFGPMPRDAEGEARYSEFMKSSKYCLCVKGYEVHSPRVIESIYYECVPVIISDNYVPPFFEILNWEAFTLFILEKDIPNLRNILLSIPEDRYIMMQRRLKIVRRYFLWHKIPERYDLFHMILHSVWYNRVLQFSEKFQMVRQRLENF